ncbi:PQQ-binding-like beta-propeller repeat protein [Actinoplanes sp. NPDC023801]|uniref:outer membrane protein assembly factor BamB family protein n=1 Tax=Actinoplanes sp. NPDC023801 TaxID=3154595 RepID=UPI0033D90182
MPADLDELFTALGRQADAIPLRGAEGARQRGRQRRTRSRAALTAAAVLLVLTGTGIAIRREQPDPEPILPATTPARIRGLAPVGEPLRIGDGRIWNNARISGDRVIGFSADGNGGHDTVAVDARTGRTLWRITGRESFFRGVATTPRAVILLRELEQHSEALDEPVDRLLLFHDPATGAKRWELRHTDRDQLVLHQDVLVRLVDDTRAIEGYDLAGGRKLWTVPAGAGRPELISGMRVESDGSEDQRGTTSALWSPDVAKAFPFTDDRLVDLSEYGRITVRDIRTGKVRSVARGRAGAEELLAYEGKIYATVRIGGVLSITTPDNVVYQREIPWENGPSLPCGPDRLCVPEMRELTSEKREGRLLMINTRTGKVIRTTRAVPRFGNDSIRLGHILTSGTGLKGTTLYDENGQARYSDNGIGGFADDGNALTLTQDAGDRRYTVRGVSNVDYRKVTLGVIPEVSGRCDWNEDVLTCPAGRELWIWRLTR